MTYSHEFSFVSSHRRSTATVPPRSFYDHPAPLATHQAYYPHEPPLYHYDNLAPHPSECLLHHGPGYPMDEDFQPNSWFQSDYGPNRVYVTPCRQLMGLGITFDGSNPFRESSLFQPMMQGNQTLPPLRMASTLERSMLALSHPPFLLPRTVSALSLETPIKTLIQSPTQPETSDEAYSSCPSTDYGTHTVPLQETLEAISLPQDPLLGTCIETEADIDIPLSMSGTEFLPSDMSTIDKAVPTSPIGSVFGIIPDVNLREMAVLRQSPVICVNPADIMGDFTPTIKSELMEEELPPSAMLPSTVFYSPSPDLGADFPEEALTAIVSILTTPCEQKESPEVSFSSTRSGESYPATLSRVRASNSCSPLSQVPITLSTTLPHLSPIQYMGPRSSTATYKQLSITNVHQGIELTEIQRLAQEFRAAHPGCELDRTFLSTFAGKLSEDGKPMPDFRCYVKGCHQMNKRRDHILVHVGSHVEHRPFVCDQCSMRFLRKNECKRHMASHFGLKPFACPVCHPDLEKSFVRQDMLKRHMRITHRMPLDEWSP